jgi:hypothetical protein
MAYKVKRSLCLRDVMYEKLSCNSDRRLFGRNSKLTDPASCYSKLYGIFLYGWVKSQQIYKVGYADSFIISQAVSVST